MTTTFTTSVQGEKVSGREVIRECLRLEICFLALDRVP